MASQTNSINIWKRVNTFPSEKVPINYTSKLIPWGYHHFDTKTRQICQKEKKKYSFISLVNVSQKIVNKTLQIWIQQ